MGVWLVPLVVGLHLREVQHPATGFAQPRSGKADELFFPLLNASDANIPLEHRKGEHGAHDEYAAHEAHGAHGHDEPVKHGGHESVKERTELEEDPAHADLGPESVDGHTTSSAHGGHGHGSEHEHEDGEGRTGEVIGKMLLGSVAFQMAIFYLVNNSDADIRRYAWCTVGTTIAIFSAVLIYGACHVVLDAYVGEEYPEYLVAISACHCIFWFLVTEIALLVIAKWKNADIDAPPKPTVILPGGNPDRSIKHSETPAILDMKCWGGFLGHVTAFASITVYMQVQRRWHHEIGPSGVFLIPAFAVVIFCAVFYVTGRIRAAVEALDGGETKSDEIWEEVAQEVENDVFAICLSFLLAECVFFLIEGEEYRVRHAYHSNGQIAACWCACGVFALLMIVVSYLRVIAARIHGNRRLIGRRRLLDILQSLFAFAFAWCGLAALSWKGDHFREHYGWTHIWTEVTVAMAIALTSVVAICIIDKIADMEGVPQNIEDCIRESVCAFGFLTGFSWEHAFHKSIEDITAEYDGVLLSRALNSFVLCVTIVIIVFPAYRWYIVPTVYRLTEQKEEFHASARPSAQPSPQTTDRTPRDK